MSFPKERANSLNVLEAPMKYLNHLLLIKKQIEKAQRLHAAELNMAKK
jgi:hypothetical protein